MPVDPETRRSLEFLTVQVSKQVEDTTTILRHPDENRIRKLRLRESQIDVLKKALTTRTFRTLIQQDQVKDTELGLVQGLNAVIDNLESIADYCNSIVVQVGYLSDVRVFDQFEPEAYLAPVSNALAMVDAGLFDRNIGYATRICAMEASNDLLFKKHFDQVTAALRSGGPVEDLISSLFILRYLERIGDALLNIGEAIIGAAVGEPLKYAQFLALEESIEEGFPMAYPEAVQQSLLEDEGIRFESVAVTRSGCWIGSIESPGVEGRWAIFKEGEAGKLRAEYDSLRTWDEARPHLVPEVFHYRERDETASLLMEMLEGRTFQHIVVYGTIGETAQALRLLTGVLEELWDATRAQEEVSAGMTRQLARRIEDVLRLHPEYRVQPAGIGRVEVRSLAETIEAMESIENELPAPFSTLIHGDLNTDNILCNLESEQVHFVDVHRSRRTDFVQDISVFLVSNLRQQDFDEGVRERLDWVMSEFLSFARNHAHEHGDSSFDARLALGLVRSMVTSTRFILVQEFAKALFLRAMYLMERLIEHRGRDWTQFRVPTDTLIYRPTSIEKETG